MQKTKENKITLEEYAAELNEKKLEIGYQMHMSAQ